MIRSLGVEQVVEIDGRKYRLSRFTISLMRRWLDWAIERIEPLRLDNLYHLSLEALSYFEDIAFTYNTLANPNIARLYESIEGQRQVVALLFDKYHWSEPLPELDNLDWLNIIKIASGTHVPDEMEMQVAYFREEKEETGTCPIKVDVWQERLKSFFENVYLTPEQVGEMTMAELSTVCRAKISQDAIWASVAKYAKATDAQRKELALQRIISLLG